VFESLFEVEVEVVLMVQVQVEALLRLVVLARLFETGLR
jgi:hypothetical protein